MADELTQDVEKELKERLKKASKNVLSKGGTTRLEQIIDKLRSIFKIELGSGGPGKVKQMKIVLEGKKRPVGVKGRNCPAGQRKYLNVYIDKLVKRDFIKTCPQAL